MDQGEQRAIRRAFIRANHPDLGGDPAVFIAGLPAGDTAGLPAGGTAGLPAIDTAGLPAGAMPDRSRIAGPRPAAVQRPRVQVIAHRRWPRRLLELVATRIGHHQRPPRVR